MIESSAMRQSKLIAITANTSWYLFNFRSNLINALVNDGHEVLAIAPLDAYSERLTMINDRVKFEPIKIDQSGTNPFKDIRTSVSFLRIYRKSAPAAVLNFTPKNNIYSTLAASRLGIPIINNIAGLGSVFINEGPVAFIARQLYRHSQNRAEKIFFQNKEDMDLFLQANFVDCKRTERLPGSGVDLARFQFTPLPDDGKIRFLLVARLLYEKGIKEYMLAAKNLKEKYPHVEFRLLGFLDANNPSAIPKHVIQAWHDEGILTYLGATDRVEEEIIKAHCMVLPSYYREGVPRSLLEGAAMGRPIITTDNVGCRETVEHNVTGFLCNSRDAASLQSAMESLITLDRASLHSMGKNSRDLVQKNFDENIVIDRYVHSLRTLLQTQG